MNFPDILLIRELSVLDESSQLYNHSILPELELKGFFSNQRFTFVGVYYSAHTGITLIGYPKYFPAHIEKHDIPAIIHHVNLICQVVEQARPHLKKSLVDSSYTFNAHSTNEELQYVNRYNLTVSLLQDYMTYGIYYSKTSHIIRNGNGAIQWQHTLQSTAPIFDRDIIYLDTFHRQNKEDYSQLVTHLHIWIVLQCARLLQGIGQYQELELPEPIMCFDDTDLSQFIPYLLGKLTTVFSDREVRLIKALSAWCGQSAFYNTQMGVTTFDKIWEYATKKVFGNIEDTRSGPPSYFFQGVEYRAYGDAIPDILRVFKHEEDGHNIIGILDAKYYCPEYDFNTHSVLSAPANADITKQIGYYRYMKQLYPQNNNKFTNAFLFPSLAGNQEMLFERTGYVCPNRDRYKEIDGLLNVSNLLSPVYQDKVLLYNINPHILFKACLNGIKIDDNAFYNSFVLPFEEE